LTSTSYQNSTSALERLEVHDEGRYICCFEMTYKDGSKHGSLAPKGHQATSEFVFQEDVTAIRQIKACFAEYEDKWDLSVEFELVKLQLCDKNGQILFGCG